MIITMAKNNEFTELKKDIRENTPKSLYLFYGEETYLRDLYTKKLIDLIDDAGFEEINKIVVDDGKNELANLPEYLEGFPMMTDKRIVCIKDSGIFKKSDDKTKKYFTDFFENLSDVTIVVFVDEVIDKRNALYKALSKHGSAVEFTPLSETDTIAWIVREASAKKLRISQQNAEYMLSICDNTLGSIENELNKLAGYCTDEILQSDIERLVSKSLQVKVFELCDYMMANNADKAVNLLTELKTVKESAFKILYILFGTFDKMLHARLMSESGLPNSDIAAAIKVPPFLAGKYINGSKGFSKEQLIKMTASAAEIDLSIKRGESDEWTALEQYVFSFFKMKSEKTRENRRKQEKNEALKIN